MKKMQLKERFFSKFRINHKTGCWEWQANRFPKGYGCFKLNGISQLAHRVSYQLHYGQIRRNLIICHKCDNPPCVNPDHLFSGTQKMNLLDRKIKNRSINGEKNGRAILKDKDILKIRKLLSKKIDQRIIAKQFNVVQTTISAINNNLTWKHI